MFQPGQFDFYNQESMFEQVVGEQKLNIYLNVLRYLEGQFLVGPSLEMFKVACLSKKMSSLIKKVYKVTDFSVFASPYTKKKIIGALESPPNLSKYM